MNSNELAAQALAALEAKADADLASLRARSEDVKSRLEQGMLNLRSRGEESAFPDASADAASGNGSAQGDLSWGFDPGMEVGGDEFGAAPPPEVLSFKDELDVATDDDGIPLGD
ncbi:MAG: hypothetical protein JO140_02955 [Candidatus Eremiobacteraeota bacterium]|nr:hypothetical protein [Candidatus Eremiobacteraeota bacterium]